ncbi:MAG: protein-disulfide reductase DsbD family protein [Polyangia bacterium]
MSRSLLRLALFALPFAGALAAPAVAGPLAGAVGDKPYTLTLNKVTAQKGQPATATVLIKPAAGYHINKDFPTTLKLTPPADVKLDKAQLAKEDATLSEKEGSFQVKLTASAAGSKKIPGELRFAVCTDTTCDPQKTAVTLEVEVK